MISNIRVGRVR